jgi:hypothetical protein
VWVLGKVSLLSTTSVVVVALGGGPASADLPATWDPQAIDNPTPALNDRFGDGIINGGDLNGDGEDDFVVGIDEHGTIAGEVHVFSGETGALIRTIPAPDPDAGGAGDNPDAFGTFVGKVGTNRSAPPFTDIGQCPGGSPGMNCAAAQGTIDTPDGVPDILASAVGVDVDANGDDMGRVYVLDGATGAVLKRIEMPPGDRAEQVQNSPTASQGGAFGRTVLSPSGQPPCDGFGGLGPCAYGATSSVAIGDVDAGGTPDIGVGASDFTDQAGGTSDAATENPLCTTTCFQTGRYYVFGGEDLAGLAPGTPLSDPLYKIKNLMTEDDDPNVNSRFHREAMGYSVAPVGDLGACNNTTPIAPTDDPNAYRCLNTANTTTPDGRPDIILSVHRVDRSGLGDVGLALAIDGRTGRVMDIYNHPEPMQAAIFGFSNYNQPAIGDAGSSVAPDVYQAAMIQDVDWFAQGEGYVLSGDFRANGANHYRISTLDDPTPFKIGNFGTSSAGVGNVAGDSRNEIMIGAYGPHAPQVIDDVMSDVHIFDPLHDTVLATIPDPDQNLGSGFGRGLAPMGDLNEDGFLDMVIGAGGFGGGTCSPCSPTTPGAAQGRAYLFRSNNTPPLAPPPVGEGASGQALRTLTLDANKGKVKVGKKVGLSGQVDASANDAECEAGQAVELQRRKGGNGAFKAFAQTQTDASGDFAGRYKVKRTYVYRAQVGQSAACADGVSNTEKVRAKKKKD